MDPTQVVLLAAAGAVAGAVNVVAGAGSLLTFPALLAAGLPPLTANVTNCLGMVPGSMTGALGMREHLRGQRVALGKLCAWTFAGSLLGAVLLLGLPSDAFNQVVPVLVGGAGLLVFAQPTIVRRVRRAEGETSPATGPSIGAVAVYSGYFGAAQGVLFIGVLGVLAPQPLARINAAKNVLAVIGNGAAGIVYAVAAPVDWIAVLVLAVGSAAGGPLGAMLARRVPANPLRIAIGVIAVLVALQLAWTTW